MKHIKDMTKKEFLNLPQLEWSTEPIIADEIFIIQNRHKHDSGYQAFTSAVRIDGKYYIVGKWHDVIHFRYICEIDCFYPNGVMRIFNNHNRDKFIIKHRLSDLDIEYEVKNEVI